MQTGLLKIVSRQLIQKQQPFFNHCLYREICRTGLHLALDVLITNQYIITWMLHQISMYSQLAKMTIPSIHPLYPIPSPSTGWTNWPINKVHIIKLNWRQIWSCQYILYPFMHLVCQCRPFSSWIFLAVALHGRHTYYIHVELLRNKIRGKLSIRKDWIINNV